MDFLSYLICAVLGWYAPVDTGLQARATEPCELYGAVYVEPVESLATYTVFVADTDSGANLRVCKQAMRASARKPGHWYFTPNKEFADFSISFATQRANADFSIAYTDYAMLAGCYVPW